MFGLSNFVWIKCTVIELSIVFVGQKQTDLLFYAEYVSV